MALNVGELLAYQPDRESIAKRGHDDDDNDDDELDRPVRKARIRDGDRYRRPGSAHQAGMSEEEKAVILEKLEQEDDMETLDEAALKRMILTFEKRVYRNQEMRIKYPDNPERFMDSELELHDTIQELHVIATAPELYHHLVELNAVQSLCQMLNHENTDISIALVDLLQELTDVDTLNESEEGADALIEALLDAQVFGMLVTNLDRLDESVKEEADGVHNTLGVIENILEFKADRAHDAAQQGLMPYLLKRIKAKMPFDANKLYCSEMLAIILQNSEETREQLGELDGIDTLLQQLATFKRHNPANSEELEMMENLFDCLCSALMLPANRDRFLKGEGLQLMNLMLREKKMSRNSALKVLDHALTGPEGVDNCTKFVDILGLRTIFPLFMKTPKPNKKIGRMKEEHEEHVVSIIASLLKNVKSNQRQRLLNKFTEADHAKVDRLMELHFKYLDKVGAVDAQIEREKVALRRQGEEVDEPMEEEFYLRRLNTGLFTLQLLDYIMLEICSTGPASIKPRVMQILNLRGGSIKAIRNIIREYAANVGDAKSTETKEAEQQRLLSLVDRF
ncbi:beta-catenin-like protein 1 [Branchiostoma lanceolatum]|uniref:CTNNBL1 protein n=1 Tax=Branchiostoma lanceolatum TaxID=7740 RepID=A0A8K0A5Z9_BRALA|nr:CTNNBL1 [Branchiostoma lanceolatum]